MDSNVGFLASCIAIFSLTLMAIFMRSSIRSRREVEKSNREVARSMRSLIRADDMLFRWGGEFLMLMFNLSQEETSRRMKKLNAIVEENSHKWPELPVTVTVSHGVAGFDSLSQLGHAIELADQVMYSARNKIRGIRVLSSTSRR